MEFTQFEPTLFQFLEDLTDNTNRPWFQENKHRYEQVGAVRVMGYNSPFVPRDRQFFEVQIPIRELSGLAAQ